MSRNSFTFGVESLEHRLLMAVLPSLPAEASAVYAPPAPHVMLDMDHGGATAADVSIPPTEGLPIAASLSIEHGPASNVLMVQFPALAQPQLVAIAGGAAAWTDGDGTVHFEISHATRQIELTLAGEQFLRIAFDAAGRIESYTRLNASSATADNPAPTIEFETHGGDAATTGFQAGLGIAMLTPAGAAIHHGPGNTALPAPTPLTAPMIGGHTSTDHEAIEAASHQVDADDPMPTGSGSDSLMSGGESSGSSGAVMTAGNRTARNSAVNLAAASQENETEPASPTDLGAPAGDLDHETVDAVFAGWAGGEETAPLESRAMFLVDVDPEKALPSDMQSQPTSRSQAELAIPVAAEQLAEALSADLDEDAVDISVWRAAAAFIFSAGCAAGAYALDRRAEQASPPSRVRPARVRRRVVQAPAAGSMAKAAM